MGQFSWLDCKDSSQIVDNAYADVYVLVPKEFGGGHIRETCYDGYGNFCGEDIYVLAAEWNRSFIKTVLSDYIGDWRCSLTQHDIRLMAAYADGEELPRDEVRLIGIYLACYDEDNFRLKYPIKITHDKNAVYESCAASKSDPDQGWLMDDDDEDEWY